MDVNNLGRNLPIDGGDLFATSKYLEALERGNTRFYYLYLMQENYFTGLYDVKGDKDLEEIFDGVKRTMFRFGVVGITKLLGDIIPVALVDHRRDLKNNVVASSGIPTSYDVYNQEAAVLKLNKKDTIFGKWGYYGFSNLFVMKTWLEDMEDILELALTNTKAKVKKWEIEVNNNNSNIIMKEMASFLDPKTPFFFNYSVDADNPFDANVFTEDKNGKHVPLKRKNVNPNTITGKESGETNVWADFNEFLKFFYMHQGRRFNYEMKKERAIKDDHTEKNINFQALEDPITKQFKKLVDDYNKTFGRKAELVFLVEENEKDAEKSNEKTSLMDKIKGKFKKGDK